MLVLGLKEECAKLAAAFSSAKGSKWNQWHSRERDLFLLLVHGSLTLSVLPKGTRNIVLERKKELMHSASWLVSEWPTLFAGHWFVKGNRSVAATLSSINISFSYLTAIWRHNWLNQNNMWDFFMIFTDCSFSQTLLVFCRYQNIWSIWCADSFISLNFWGQETLILDVMNKCWVKTRFQDSVCSMWIILFLKFDSSGLFYKT